jgi:hypothetical protein
VRCRRESSFPFEVRGRDQDRKGRRRCAAAHLHESENVLTSNIYFFSGAVIYILVTKKHMSATPTMDQILEIFLPDSALTISTTITSLVQQCHARADVLAARRQLRASIVQAQEAQELELGLEQALGMETVATAELGDGGGTPAPKQGERLAESPPGDELPSPAVRLRRFQLLEQHYSSGDTTVIERDRLKTHTHTSGVRPTSGTLL